METVILFDTSIGSLNKGDEIIMESVVKQLHYIIENRYVMRSTTHSPVISDKQGLCNNIIMETFNNAKYKFICGTNLLWRNLNYEWPTWNVNLLNYFPYRDSILIGVGSGKYHHEPDDYTKELYNKILSHDYVHSVRDDNTVELLKTLGFQAVNTGCPTMWGFSEEFCKKIPSEKAEKVVFTLTFYNMNNLLDQKLIDILFDSYKEVYFWSQGVNDFQYLKKLNLKRKLNIVPPDLKSYSRLLSDNNIDYIGTRLHGGLFAMQHKKRTIIIVIDNRARYMKQNYSLKTIERQNISLLKDTIFSSFKTKINLDYENIKKYISQFDVIQYL